MTQRYTIGRRNVALIATILLLAGLLATAGRTIVKYQTPGPFDPSRQGMCDYHNGIYFPTRALLAGTSPYGAEYAADNPVSRQIPFFSPGILVLHAPLAILPLRVSEVLFFTISVMIVIAIAMLVASVAGMPRRFDAVIAVAAAIMFTRAGHVTLFDGYFTFELVLATFLAIHWGRRRPILAAIALAVVSAKPTYILPLGFLMLARGNVKALLIGAVISIAAAGFPFAWLAYHEGDGDMAAGLANLREQISTSQEIHRAQEDESPVHSWTRMDLLAVVAKWTDKDPSESTHLLVMALLLAPPMLLLYRRRLQAIDDGLGGMTGAIILTAMLVSLYHQSYDAMLLAPPLAGVLIGRLDTWKTVSVRTRLLVSALMGIPAYNYLSTRMILGRLDPEPWLVRSLTSLNGVCLTILLVLICFLATTKRDAKAEESMQPDQNA